MVLTGFLHQHPQRVELVCASSALVKTILVLLQEGVSSWLHPVQQNTSEHLAGDIQECNAPVVITLRAAILLVKGDDDVVEPV